MQKIVSEVKSLESPRWGSSKLWLTVGLIAGFIWLFNSAINLTIWPITILAGIWLVCRTVEGVSEGINKRKVNEKLIDAAKEDGLTPEEISAIDK
jgi:uncharacterized membrane protein HdeD (DUF308 family)